MGLKWAINGFDFLDFGVHVSESKGVLDKLKPRERNSYTWTEYHGKQIDLSAPKYEAREISLSCWIKALNIDDLTDNFNAFLSFFDRNSTSRLSLTPFNQKPYAYEVILINGVELEKELREGEMYGSFTLSLIEPNPIKKILKTELDTLRIKYTSPYETEIFPGDGTKLIGRGDVDFLLDYSKPNYEGSGISLVQGSALNSQYYEVYTVPTTDNSYQFTVEVTLASPQNIKFYILGRKPDNTYELIENSPVIEAALGINYLKVVAELVMSNYTKFFYKVLDSSGNEIPGIVYSNPKIETAEVVGNWQDMLGKEKIIIIAGNIDDVTIVETPAEVIWEKI
ncbi:hypothetical protein U9K52_09765 [Chryseobacterium sp. MHB01]|uniref:hypothetical protein n=1 Tax=Chryseobacterium sp. MHB01 TaxID=3109433 RepID=UPI002B001B36|nr:hypothetical protein [Chryseobacterium sp. MHB01]MEA1849198.1 hypothetical protein [Chryseobacterium sp. MHB01]